MSKQLHVDFSSIAQTGSSLESLKVGSSGDSGLDLSGVCSDIVASAGSAFASGWSDALGILNLSSSGLASGLDATLKDFIATEQAHLESIASIIGELDR